MKNIELKEGFKQVCVWPGTIVGKDEAQNFEEFFLEQMKVRVQYLEDLYTNPDQENGHPVEGTGGRCDCFFAVHDDDVMKFSVPRLSMGIRWIEDVYSNGHKHLYPARVAKYRCW